MTAINQAELPTFEARDIGGTWDIVMRIPHVSGHGATVEQIIIIAENCGVAPEEATIARRVESLLNMSAHIDTEDLFIKGATLKLQTFSESVAPAEPMTDRESDLIDTCEALRRSLRIIGNKFGIKPTADSDMFANKIVEEFEALQRRYSRDAFPTAELREIIGKPDATAQSLLTYVRNLSENAKLYATRADKATDQLEHIEKLLIEHEHHTEGAALWASVDKLIDRVQVLSDEEGLHLINTERALADAAAANKETAGQLAKADNELATSRGLCDEAYGVLKDISRVLGVTVEEPKALIPVVTKLANDLTSAQSAQTTLQPFKIQVMQLCMIEPSSPSMLPSLPELLEGIRDYVNTITRYRGGAMILHDLACQLTQTDNPATDAEPYANIPWQVIADRLEEKFYAPRNAIATLLGNFELEVKDDYRDNVSELYSFLKGLTVAQYKTDTNLQTLLRERNADRAIIGAIDDLCGDVANRPLVPVMAAVRALVQSHITAIYAKGQPNG